jgi:hypothetical protein
MGFLTRPSTSRLPASEPSLRQPALGLLQGVFGPGNVQQNLGSRIGFQLPPELQSAFANFLVQPTADQRTNASTLAQQGALGGANAIPGFDVLSALGPVFQRNLTEALGRQNEVGPRFASAAQRESRTLEQQGLQDFNVLAQQILEQGRQRQLQGMLGYGQLQLGAQQNQLAALGPLLQALFGGGLSGGITVGPSALGQLAGLAGSGAALATSLRRPGGTG